MPPSEAPKEAALYRSRAERRAELELESQSVAQDED
jgi:hypothetical protein